jgi:hypothetical protein
MQCLSVHLLRLHERRCGFSVYDDDNDMAGCVGCSFQTNYRAKGTKLQAVVRGHLARVKNMDLVWTLRQLRARRLLRKRFTDAAVFMQTSIRAYMARRRIKIVSFSGK